MSATAFDAQATDLRPSGRQVEPDPELAPTVRLARLRVRHWFWWLAAPPALLIGAAVMQLDRNFVAVGLVFAALILIRIVQACSDLDMARREASGKLSRRQVAARRRGR